MGDVCVGICGGSSTQLQKETKKHVKHLKIPLFLIMGVCTFNEFL